ncbi:hypothetical protein AKJ16_DCAP14253, partial [Drosera capensis]
MARALLIRRDKSSFATSGRMGLLASPRSEKPSLQSELVQLNAVSPRSLLLREAMSSSAMARGEFMRTIVDATNENSVTRFIFDMALEYN